MKKKEKKIEESLNLNEILRYIKKMTGSERKLNGFYKKEKIDYKI